MVIQTRVSFTGTVTKDKMRLSSEPYSSTIPKEGGLNVFIFKPTLTMSPNKLAETLKLLGVPAWSYEAYDDRVVVSFYRRTGVPPMIRAEGKNLQKALYNAVEDQLKWARNQVASTLLR